LVFFAGIAPTFIRDAKRFGFRWRSFWHFKGMTRCSSGLAWRD